MAGQTDPRTADAATVNEELVNLALQHRIRLERFGANLNGKVLELLNASFVAVTARLAERLVKIETAGFDAGPATTKRLEHLRDDLAKLIDQAYGKAQALVQGDLFEFAAYEAEYTRASTVGAMPVNWQMTMPATATLEALVTELPIAGHFMDDWVADLSYSTKQRLNAAIQAGILEGQTTAQIVRTIRGTREGRFTDGILEASRRNAETWVRTSVAHVSSHARQKVWAENADLISGLKWLATLDSRTSEICRARDGKIYPLDQGPRPPAHPNCRSTMVPVLRDADELGIKLPPGQRASMNGQVPDDVTYGAWLKKQPREFVEETMGKAKAALFLDGGLPIEKFVREPDGKAYTLKELREREKSAFKRAGV